MLVVAPHGERAVQPAGVERGTVRVEAEQQVPGDAGAGGTVQQHLGEPDGPGGADRLVGVRAADHQHRARPAVHGEQHQRASGPGAAHLAQPAAVRVPQGEPAGGGLGLGGRGVAGRPVVEGPEGADPPTGVGHGSPSAGRTAAGARACGCAAGHGVRAGDGDGDGNGAGAPRGPGRGPSGAGTGPGGGGQGRAGAARGEGGSRRPENREGRAYDSTSLSGRGADLFGGALSVPHGPSGRVNGGRHRPAGAHCACRGGHRRVPADGGGHGRTPAVREAPEHAGPVIRGRRSVPRIGLPLRVTPPVPASGTESRRKGS